MGSRIFTKRLLVIAGCLVLLAALVILGSWYLFGRGQLTIQRAGNLSWGWTKAAGVKPAGQHVVADQGEVLVIWCADAPGPNDVTLESRLFGYRFNPKGFFTLPGGKRIDWHWDDPRNKAGDLEIDGKHYDVAQGGLFLVSTQDGQIHVAQFDVDLTQGFDNWAKKEPKVAKFWAEATGQK